MDDSHAKAFRIIHVNVIVTDRSGSNTFYTHIMKFFEHWLIEHRRDDIDHVVTFRQLKIIHARRLRRIIILDPVFGAVFFKTWKFVKRTHAEYKHSHLLVPPNIYF